MKGKWILPAVVLLAIALLAVPALANWYDVGEWINDECVVVGTEEVDVDVHPDGKMTLVQAHCFEGGQVVEPAMCDIYKAVDVEDDFILELYRCGQPEPIFLPLVRKAAP